MSDTYAQRRVRQMSDQELRLFQDAIVQEQALRRRLDASPEKIEHAIAEYQKATGKGQGEPWSRPTGHLDAFSEGAEVEHGGERWLSTHSNNTGEPGISGWRLKPELDEDGNEIPPRYVQPAGAHDGYPKGRRITWEDGLVYEAARDGVAHSPAEYAPDWILVEAEPDPPEDEEPVEPEEPGEDDDDEGDPSEPEIPAWNPDGHQYSAGDEVEYDGAVYRVVQDHTSQPGWTPDAVPALYERV